MAKYSQFYAIMSAIRRAFVKSPAAKEAMKAAICPHKKGPKGGKRFCCAGCRPDSCKICTLNLTEGAVEKDHVEPIVPIGTLSKDMSWDKIVSRTFVEASGIQILCKPCHKIKSKEENEKRKKVKNGH